MRMHTLGYNMWGRLLVVTQYILLDIIECWLTYLEYERSVPEHNERRVRHLSSE